jgi:hypothetical protein
VPAERDRIRLQIIRDFMFHQFHHQIGVLCTVDNDTLEQYCTMADNNSTTTAPVHAKPDIQYGGHDRFDLELEVRNYQ